jgi:uncharacterized protein (TIGR00296 family)
MDIEDGKILVKLARDAISTSFTGAKLDLSASEKFKEKQGVFVTLRLYEQLRGCIGFPTPVYPLQRAVIEASRAAAFKDPRFPEVAKEEFDDICVEVSVLTVPKLIEVESPEEYMDKIIVGRHGLIIKKEWKSGLLLPQVFSDLDCTPKEALEMVCEKANLEPDEWKEDAEVFTFSAEIFSEEDPGGAVVKTNNE